MKKLFFLLTFALASQAAQCDENCIPDFSEKRGCEMTENQFQTVRFYLQCRRNANHSACVNRVGNQAVFAGSEFIGITDGLVDTLKKDSEYRSRFVDGLKEIEGGITDPREKKTYLAVIAILAGANGVEGATEVAKVAKNKPMIQEATNFHNPIDRPGSELDSYDVHPTRPDMNSDTSHRGSAGYADAITSPLGKETVALAENSKGELKLTAEQEKTIRQFFNDLRERNLLKIHAGQETHAIEASRYTLEGTSGSFDDKVYKLRLGESYYQPDGSYGSNDVLIRHAQSPEGRVKMAGPGLKAFGAGLAVTVAVAAMDIVDLKRKREAACDAKNPLVPFKGESFNSGAPGRMEDCREVYYDLDDKSAKEPWQIPPPILQYFSLKPDEQRALMLYQSSNPMGICNYLSRAYDTAFQGTKFCNRKSPENSTIEVKENGAGRATHN